MKDVLEMCEDMYSPQYGYQLIAKLVSFMLASVPEGRYMLVHPPGASCVMCFKALPDELQTTEVRSYRVPERRYSCCARLLSTLQAEM